MGKQEAENMHLRQTAILYGSALAMELSLERAICASTLKSSKRRRPFGIPSSNHCIFLD